MARTVAVIIMAALCWFPAPVSAQPPAPASGQDTTGRVVATVTTLDGTVYLPAVDVGLRTASDPTIIAKSVTDSAGQVVFPDIPPGRYIITGTRPGFVETASPEFEVRPGAAARVLLDIDLTFVLPTVEVRSETPSPTNSVQPVSLSDMLSGSIFELAPLEGDDFQSLLLLLPGIVRGPDGRLRIKGGQPSQSALQVSSASLNDPSTGDLDLELPSPAVESVEVLANPFAAEYGRFSSSITQIRTRRGTNDWEIKPGNLIPRFGQGLIRAFEPSFSVHGPLKRDRLFLAEDIQPRYVKTPVRSLPDEPVITLKSFDWFTRVDAVLSARHTLGGGLIAFPRKIENVTLSTFRPEESAPEFRQNGWSTGIVDRLALTPNVVLDSSLTGRWFEVHTDADGTLPMIYGPETQSGPFYNDQAREVASQQWVESLSISRNLHGPHVIKFGTDMQRSGFTGFNDSRPVAVRRLDGSLAELTTFGPRSFQDTSGIEFAAFVQDRWRAGSRVTFELGFRMDRDAVIERLNWSPRAGVAVAVAPEGRAILRGGFGKFAQRTPRNIDAFPSFESRTISRYAPGGVLMSAPITYVNVLEPELRTPEANVGNVEWNQRFGRRMLLKLEFMQRRGAHEFTLYPDPAAGLLRLGSSGVSRYQEFEATTRYVGGEHRDLTVSYVWAKGTADLNNYDQFYGNLRNPIVRANENNLIPTDVRHRVVLRGTFGLPWKFDFAPVLEVRSGFPWSAVDEYQDFVGPRNQTGRLPMVHTLDFTLARPWQVGKYRFRAGLKVYNGLGRSADRDVQNNVTSPEYGQFYNPIERSIGFTFGTSK